MNIFECWKISITWSASLNWLFATYTSPIATITRSFQVCHQQCADDTQLFIALNPSDPSSDIVNLTSCLHALHSWFCLIGMALNPDKSDAMLLGTRQRSKTFVSVRSVDVAGCWVLLSDSIKILGVTLDCHLSLDKHISSICKSAYYHIRSLRHIPSAITDDMAKSVASSLVCSRLDYTNSFRHHSEKYQPSSARPKFTCQSCCQSRSPSWNSLIWYSPGSALAPNWSTHWIQTCHIDIQHSQLLSTCLSTFSAQLSHSHTFSAFCQHQSFVGSTCPHNLCLPPF